MKKRWLGRQFLLLSSVLSLSLPWCTPSVEAATKNIRVALFVDTGQGYRGVVPSVTLTSDAGLEIKAADQNHAVTVPLNATQARFRVDEFAVIAGDTPDLGEAQRIAQTLSKQKLDATIIRHTKAGAPAYQVLSGSYNTYETAVAQSKTIAQKTGKQVMIKGPYRVEAGTYANLAEARKWENSFETTGVTAHTVLLLDQDKPVYAVWLGDEVTQAKLSPVVAMAGKVNPKLKYNDAKSSSYVLLNEEVVVGGSNVEAMPQFAFSPKVKLTVSPKKASGTPLITVEEREHRKYRGSFELSDYKNNLTVVNDLPLEQYLYGVVGSEMVTGWPLEALKAQAVLARTRAVGQGNKYGIANLSDTVYEQAYYGYAKEASDIRKAVDATEGEVIRYNGKVVESLFYSNAGGTTADGTEVWGNPVPYLAVVDSPDTEPREKATPWYQVSLSDGTIGYLRSDFITKLPDRNSLGLQQGYVTTDNVNFRIGPSSTYHKAISTLARGTEVTIISVEPEENAYQWTRGPYTAQELTAMVNASQARNKAAQFNRPIQSIEVSQHGPSGRVTEIMADGMAVAASTPDAYRSVFTQGSSSLRSTKFDIEQLAQVMVLGAGNQTAILPQAPYELQTIGTDGYGPRPANGSSEDYVIYNGTPKMRVASKQPEFLLRGYGFGHGLGVSQYGAKALAEQGYDYQQILLHYYQDVTIDS